MRRMIVCLLALCASVPASAAPQGTDMCREAPLPPEPWTSWMQSGTAIAGGEAATAPRLILGKPTLATLRPVTQVQFAAPVPALVPKSHGGLFTLALKAPARVGIALSGAAWIDVVTDHINQPSVDHGHGPECSGIRKIVWFDLQPGAHVVQIANAPAREIRVMAADALANRARVSADDGS